MSEKIEHRQICQYIRTQYPNVIFNTDLSGIKLNQGQAIAIKSLRCSNGFPDIVIYEPKKRSQNNPFEYNGLFIELKRTGEVLLKRNGMLKTDHLKEQSNMINNLVKKGYYACFCIGFDEAKRIIDWYLSE